MHSINKDDTFAANEGKDTAGTKGKSRKFLMCIDLQLGFYIIGALEVVATVI